MNKKQKAKLYKVIVSIVLSFFLAVLIVPQITIADGSTGMLTDIHSKLSDINVNFQEMWMLYAFILVLVFGALKFKRK